MIFNATKRAYIGAIIGLVFASLAFCFSPTINYAPTGIYLPLAKDRMPISISEVKLFSSYELPLPAKKMGEVNVEFRAKKTDEKSKAQVLNYAKQLASEHGGNVIVPTQFFLAKDNPPNVFTTRIVFQGEVFSNPVA